MGCLGVHFSFDKGMVDKLKSFATDEERLDYLQEEIEETYFDKHPKWVGQTDKAWDAIHRALTDGKLEWSNGEYPLNHVILGGELLYNGDDYIMSLKTPQQVQDVAHALESMTYDVFRVNYFNIDPDEYGSPVDEGDFGYTWSWFESLKEFWRQAATEGRYVLFTADQ